MMELDSRLYHQLDCDFGKCINEYCWQLSYPIFSSLIEYQICLNISFSEGSQERWPTPNPRNMLCLAKSVKIFHPLARKCSGLVHVTQLWIIRKWGQSIRGVFRKGPLILIRGPGGNSLCSCTRHHQVQLGCLNYLGNPRGNSNQYQECQRRESKTGFWNLMFPLVYSLWKILSSLFVSQLK